MLNLGVADGSISASAEEVDKDKANVEIAPHTRHQESVDAAGVRAQSRPVEALAVVRRGLLTPTHAAFVGVAAS